MARLRLIAFGELTNDGLLFPRAAESTAFCEPFPAFSPRA
jgi:hypothetical protein